jgi:hypothetical protein
MSGTTSNLILSRHHKEVGATLKSLLMQPEFRREMLSGNGEAHKEESKLAGEIQKTNYNKGEDRSFPSSASSRSASSSSASSSRLSAGSDVLSSITKMRTVSMKETRGASGSLTLPNHPLRLQNEVNVLGFAVDAVMY